MKIITKQWYWYEIFTVQYWRTLQRYVDIEGLTMKAYHKTRVVATFTNPTFATLWLNGMAEKEFLSLIK